MQSLSVAIITFNEERIIEKTLLAVKDWVNEIVVVDSFSTDSTLNILKKHNVKIFQETWRGYSKQKNLALSKCSGDWILVIDADEIVPAILRDEILDVLQKQLKYNGYRIKRKFYIGDRWIKFGGYYPDSQLRLIKNNVNAFYENRAVHESISVKGSICTLKYPLEHYAYRDLNDYKKSLKKYAQLASREIKKKKKYVPGLRATWAFILRYIFRLGLLEGRLGYFLNKAYGEYVYEKYKLASESNIGKESISLVN